MSNIEDVCPWPPPLNEGEELERLAHLDITNEMGWEVGAAGVSSL